MPLMLMKSLLPLLPIARSTATPPSRAVAHDLDPVGLAGAAEQVDQAELAEVILDDLAGRHRSSTASTTLPPCGITPITRVGAWTMNVTRSFLM